MNPDMLLTGTMGDLVTTRNASLPSPAELRLIFEALSKFITQYESSPKDEKREILKHIQDAAISLARTSASPMEGLMSFLFQPHHNACVRVAIGMGVFDHITARGGPISLELLAEKTGSEPEFVFRILRALVAMDILHESQPGYYSHTPLSELLADRGIQAYAVHQWDNINFCMSQFGSYFEKHGYRSPADPKNAPFTCAMGMENASFFEILELNPTRMDVFNRGMAGFNTGVVALYDFGSLENISQEAVAIVDVGGGNGHTLLEILDTFPALKGRCVLQDLPAVLQGNVVIPDGDICLQPYDFFREVQPVNGAAIYLYKWIFHDWPDADCRTILRNLSPAMKNTASKLLICDIVIADHNPEIDKVHYDINMLCIAGKERSLTEWHNLLRSTGFRIVQVHSKPSSTKSIIEAILVD